jgi:hypothetical protein
MASITTAMLAADLDYAIADAAETCVVISPPGVVGFEFVGCRNSLAVSYSVEMAGRILEISTRFSVKKTGLVSVPEKGWIFTAGAETFKIISTRIDPSGVGLLIDVVDQNFSG